MSTNSNIADYQTSIDRIKNEIFESTTYRKPDNIWTSPQETWEKIVKTECNDIEIQCTKTHKISLQKCGCFDITHRIMKFFDTTSYRMQHTYGLSSKLTANYGDDFTSPHRIYRYPDSSNQYWIINKEVITGRMVFSKLLITKEDIDNSKKSHLGHLKSTLAHIIKYQIDWEKFEDFCEEFFRNGRTGFFQDRCYTCGYVKLKHTLKSKRLVCPLVTKHEFSNSNRYITKLPRGKESIDLAGSIKIDDKNYNFVVQVKHIDNNVEHKKITSFVEHNKLRVSKNTIGYFITTSDFQKRTLEVYSKDKLVQKKTLHLFNMNQLIDHIIQNRFGLYGNKSNLVIDHEFWNKWN